MEIGTTYRLRTPKTVLGEGGGRGKRNLKANSLKRKSVDGYIIKLSEVQLVRDIIHQRYGYRELSPKFQES